MSAARGSLWGRLKVPALTGVAGARRTRLFVCLHAAPEQSVWALWHADGTLERGVGLGSIPEAARERAVTEVWTPPQETLLAEARLPPQGRARVAQALPYALEEQLLGEPEQFQFAYREVEEGRFIAAVTSKAQLAAWQALLAGAGLAADVLCPANLRLPWTEGEWSLAFVADAVWVRCGETAGLSSFGTGRLPPALLVSALRALPSGSGPARLRLYDAPPELDLIAWEALGIPLVSDHLEPCTPPDEPAPFNLLRSGEERHSHQALRALRPAAWLLALWLSLGLLMHLVQWFRLYRIEARQQAEMVTLFTRAFPEEHEIVDPPLQMRRDLALLKQRSGVVGANDFLPLLDRVAAAAGPASGFSLKSLRYGAGGLRIDVDVGGFAALDALQGQLHAHGLSAQVLTADSSGGKVHGRLEVHSSS